MAQVSMTVRMDSELKLRFESFCKETGMSVNTAINIFANAVVRTHSIPFKIGADAPEFVDDTLKAFREFRASVTSGSAPELTLDEINKEIKLARVERAVKKK